jgi:hypothetical protein
MAANDKCSSRMICRLVCVMVVSKNIIVLAAFLECAHRITQAMTKVKSSAASHRNAALLRLKITSKSALFSRLFCTLKIACVPMFLRGAKNKQACKASQESAVEGLGVTL